MKITDSILFQSRFNPHNDNDVINLVNRVAPLTQVQDYTSLVMDIINACDNATSYIVSTEPYKGNNLVGSTTIGNLHISFIK